jgi:hypothetical protein
VCRDQFGELPRYARVQQDTTTSHGQVEWD